MRIGKSITLAFLHWDISGLPREKQTYIYSGEVEHNKQTSKTEPIKFEK